MEEQPAMVVKCPNGATVRIFSSCCSPDPAENQRRIAKAYQVAHEIAWDYAVRLYEKQQQQLMEKGGITDSAHDPGVAGRPSQL